jgi:DNA-binding NarL/FixJ family response regulator
MTSSTVPQPRVRVAVIDDQPLVRVGLRGIVELAHDLTVVAEAADGAEAVRIAHTQRPDVVLMDVRMPGMDGLEATRLICAHTDARVVVLTTFDLDEYIFTAIRHGASGFLLKDAPVTQVHDAIRAAAAGDALLAPTITRRVLQRLATDPTPTQGTLPPVAAVELTPRESDVLDLVAAGLANAEIARQLHIGLGTVKTHVSNLLAKMHARDRIHLVLLAHNIERHLES